MARIFLSMAGEGRGHATRARSMVEQLRRRHEIELFAPRDAYDFLAPLYRRTEVRVHRIPGPHFHYTADHKLHYPRTGKMAWDYLRGLPGLTRKLARYFERREPDLCVVDFEPAIPRACAATGIPYISVNHQHFLLACDLSDLPPRIRRHTAYMGGIVRLYHGRQVRTVVSSFFFPPVKPKWRHATMVGTLLRPELLAAEPSRAGHLLAYIRKHETPEITKALRGCGREVLLYGLGKRPRDGNISYLPINEATFLEHLASCEAIVCTAGNQLMGESLFLGKPVYALPELNNWEQYINAFYCRQAGCGEWSDYDKITPRALAAFLERADDYRGNMDRDRLNGIPPTIEAIEQTLRDIGAMPWTEDEA